MQKLIFLSGVVVVVLAAIASAAPVAEEVSELQTPDINQLLAEANPDDNDIAAPMTDSPVADEGTGSPAVGDDPTSQSTAEVVADVTEEDVAVPVTPTAASPVETATVEEPVIVEQPVSSNKTDIVDDKEKAVDGGDLVPVTEVIPPPKVAHVLGEGDESEQNQETVEENMNDYQIVQGENEQGTPFISEFVPTSPSSLEVEAPVAPIVEQIRYEYPSEDIRPGAAFRPDQSPDTIPVNVFTGDAQYDDYSPEPQGNPDYIDEMIEHAMMNSGMNFNANSEGPVGHDYPTNPDNIHDYSDDYAPNYDYPTDSNFSPDYPTDSHFSPDYPTDSHFSPDYPTDTHFSPDYPSIGFNVPMDYSDDFPTTSFDESVQHEAQMSPSEGELVEEQNPMQDETEETENDSVSSSFMEGIVAGLHENYHPEPISGMMPEENMPDADYHVYDEPIIPAAMVNVDSPAVEENNFEEEMPSSQMPQIPEMVAFPQPVAEFTVQNEPMASMHPMDHDDMMNNDFVPSDINNEIENDNAISAPSVDDSIDNALDVFDAEPATNNQGVLIIKLDIPSQKAHVNGKPFMIERSSNILSFVELLLRNAMMRSKMPTDDDIPSGFSPDSSYSGDESFHPEMTRPLEPENFFNDSPFMYSQYNEPEPIYPTSFNYNPYNPFLSGLRRRMMMARQNRMSSFNNRFDYDSMPFNNHYDDQYFDQYDGPFNGQYYDQYNGYGSRYNSYW